jgi:CTP synthase
MHIASIEFARNVLNLKNATSEEFSKKAKDLVIGLLPNQKNVKKGGTMRLGSYACKVKTGSILHDAYKESTIHERHRHRYEFNNSYKKDFEKAGMIFSGTSPDGNLMEVIELKDHRWYLACQFHPEFKSRPVTGHPLFKAFIEKVKDFSGVQQGLFEAD